MPSPLRIYVSSTSMDLAEKHRPLVIRAIQRLGHVAVNMENYVADGRTPVRKCLDDVGSCQAYVGIFAWRYGHVPADPECAGKSITELEYLEARRKGIPTLIFILHEDAAWPRTLMDKGAAAECIEKLRAELQSEQVVSFFHTEADLESQCTVALTALRPAAGPHGDAPPDDPIIVGTRPQDVSEFFKDRVQEIQALRRMLDESTGKLLCIVGQGGIGKTALLSKLCAEREEHARGIIYLSCRGADRPTVERLFHDFGRLLGPRAADELMRCWNDPSRSEAEKTRFLLSKLRAGEYLLVLDNVEDALDAENRLADESLRSFIDVCLTEGGHKLRLIVTSRERLQVSSRAMRTVREVPLDKGLPEEDAIALLRDFDPQGNLGLRDAKEATLADAARRCHGIPYGLESIAFILNKPPHPTLEKLLADGTIFNAKVIENLTVERYRRATDDQRRALEALAVFHKPVPADAVRHLLEPFHPNVNVDECLGSLVQDYFVSFIRGRGTFELHPLDQRFIYSKIPDADGTCTKQACHRRAAEYYASVRKPRSEWKALEDLAPLLEEFDQRCTAADYTGAFNVLNMIDYNCLFWWGFYRIQAEMHERLHGKLPEKLQQAMSLNALSKPYARLGRIEEAIARQQEAVAIARELNLKHLECNGLNDLGVCYGDLGDNRKAIEFYRESLTLAQPLGNKSEATLNSIGFSYAALGEPLRALRYLHFSIAASREAQHPNMEAIAVKNLGYVLTDLGEAEYAAQLVKLALEKGDALRSQQVQHFGRHRLAWACVQLGDPPAARVAIDAALEFDMPRNKHQVLALRGLIALKQGDEPAARASFAEALQHTERMIQYSPKNYNAMDTQGLAYCGLALCENPEHSRKAIDAYRRARAINSDAGMVGRQLRLFDALATCDQSQKLKDVRSSISGSAGVVGVSLPQGFIPYPAEDLEPGNLRRPSVYPAAEWVAVAWESNSPDAATPFQRALAADPFFPRKHWQAFVPACRERFDSLHLYAAGLIEVLERDGPGRRTFLLSEATAHRLEELLRPRRWEPVADVVHEPVRAAFFPVVSHPDEWVPVYFGATDAPGARTAEFGVILRDDPHLNAAEFHAFVVANRAELGDLKIYRSGRLEVEVPGRSICRSFVISAETAEKLIAL